MSYLKATADYALTLINEGDLWSECFIGLYVDANHNKKPPCKADDGHMVTVDGVLGTFMGMDWSKKKQGIVTTNSGESESVAWSRAIKTAIKWVAVMEKTTTNAVPIRGYNDNEAVRIAFTHGSSAKMAHMTRHAGVHFEFVRSIGLIPRHIDGEDNLSDMFNKILGAKRLRCSDLTSSPGIHVLP